MTTDMRLKKRKFNYCGKEYVLTCNMNVLAEVQEAYGGNFGEAIRSGNTMKSGLTFLAAMLNDYADTMGWDEHHTAKSVGRDLGMREMEILTECMQLVSASLTTGENADEEESEKK